jgi:hypothetical protein
MVNPNVLHSPFFVTLTYHNNYPETSEDIKRDMDSFLKRLKRALPDIFYFWRLELQKRGAPHYHLILWSKVLDEPISHGSLLKTLKDIWIPYINCGCSACRMSSVMIRSVTNITKAAYYISKYMAKTEIIAQEMSLGRLWGVSRDLPKQSINFITGNADSVTLLQSASLLWCLQYTHSKPDYLISLFYRKDVFLFIPAQIIERLTDAISRGSDDPCAEVAQELQIEKKRTITFPELERPANGSPSPSCSQGTPAHGSPGTLINSRLAYIADVTLSANCATNKQLSLLKSKGM